MKQQETEGDEKIGLLRQMLDQAEAVVIGAGAGLSTAAGYEYGGARFQRYFSDFHRQYGITDMYTGGFYPFETKEEYWAWWSRQIWVNRYMDPPKPVYQQLRELVEGKEYFVITTNVDHCFQKAGFPKDRLFYTQGDYGLFQCSGPCCPKTYDNEEVVRAMVEQQKDMKVPENLLPFCPVCGRPMTTNLRVDEKFVEDEGWHHACSRYEEFLKEHQETALFLELGVGSNTPSIIKYPFWHLTTKNHRAHYAAVNHSQAICPRGIEDRSVCLRGDIELVLTELLQTA